MPNGAPSNTSVTRIDVSTALLGAKAVLLGGSAAILRLLPCTHITCVGIGGTASPVRRLPCSHIALVGVVRRIRDLAVLPNLGQDIHLPCCTHNLVEFGLRTGLRPARAAVFHLIFCEESAMRGRRRSRPRVTPIFAVAATSDFDKIVDEPFTRHVGG